MAGDLAYGILALREQATRQQMEAVLKDSEEKYRNVVERANDGITIIQDGRVIFANQRLVELWGGTIEEVIGASFIRLMSPQTLAISWLNTTSSACPGSRSPPPTKRSFNGKMAAWWMLK